MKTKQLVSVFLVMALAVSLLCGCKSNSEPDVIQYSVNTVEAAKPAAVPSVTSGEGEAPAAIPESFSQDIQVLEEEDEPDEPPMPDFPAEEITFRFFGAGYHVLECTDHNYYTSLPFKPGETMELRAEEGTVGSVYLVWDDPPFSGFSISVDGTEYEFEGSPYLHQYVYLPQAGTSIVITDSSEEVRLNEAYAFSEGYPPEWVQRWKDIPEKSHADLLLFPTHGDDEYLFFGGIIPYYAGERGLKVQLVYMTHHVGYMDYRRNHEILDGLWTAGDVYYPVINMQNDTMWNDLEWTEKYYGYDNFTGFQVEQIRRFKPSVIVSHDFEGEYKHYTHVLNALCLKDAVEFASDSAKYPESAEKYGTWDTPKFYVHLYGENSIVLDYETPMEHFGGKTAFEVASEAFACHSSQEYYTKLYSFDSEYDCHKFGLYRSTVGNDVTGKDLMENIPER